MRITNTPHLIASKRPTPKASTIAVPLVLAGAAMWLGPSRGAMALGGLGLIVGAGTGYAAGRVSGQLAVELSARETGIGRTCDRHALDYAESAPALTAVKGALACGVAGGLVGLALGSLGALF